MAIAFTRWDRRDSADRAALGLAALAYCRAAKDAGVRARFYWSGADSIVILNEAEAPGALDQTPTTDVAKTLFDLADLAHQTAQERWIDPRSGTAAYQAAGR